ncbi:hypothetical protein [Pseudoalteromonas sp.]|uniref:hypothetical protein n=1 Tax=Pseudoalteromonas sp. TaxID=53249 RepID=UPI0030028F11
MSKQRRYDFKVKYYFYTESEGGRKTLPFNGYRSDWFYDGDDLNIEGLSMIWPTFENKSGDIFENEINVQREGFARMTVVVPEIRKSIHQKRIKIGTKGFFMEGSKKVAEAEVVEILDLHKDEI